MGLEMFTDADWVGNKGDQKSTVGCVISLGGRSISRKSKNQIVVVLSSAEAEYVSLSMGALELVWIQKLFWEFFKLSPLGGSALIFTSTVFFDNNAALAIATNEQIGPKNKHMSVKYHYI